MSFNKAKSLKAASKYVQQGKYEAAIEEYRRIVQADPQDVPTFNTLGDLYVKAGYTDEAMRCFMQVAENYRVNGFNLKAIAMLKKVSKLDPANVEIGLNLAALYAQQKLIVDARHQYLAVAEHYLREGQAQRALDIYQKVADLDPENTSIQIKLAEAYLREAQHEQAYEAFVAAAGELRRQRKEEEALEVYLRALSANPRGQLALSSVINLYIQRNDIMNAVALVERLLQERPSDAELLILLSRVHQSRGDLEKAEGAIARALEGDRARYQYALDLAALFAQQGDVDGALRQYDRVAATLAEYREDEKGVLLLRDVLSEDAHHFGALERLAAVYARTNEDHLLIETLNTLAEAAIHQGHSQTAIGALGHLLQLEPDEIQHRRRLRGLGLSDEDVQHLTVAGAAAGHEAEGYGQPPDDVPFDTPPVHQTSNETPPASAAAEEYEPDVAPAVSEFAAYEPSRADSVPDLQYGATSPEYKSLDETSRAAAAHTEFVPEPGYSSDHQSGDLETDARAGEVTAGPVSLGDEIESVEFYIMQGMLDVARYTLSGLEQQFPKHPEVAAIRAQLEAAEAAAGVTPGPELSGGAGQTNGHSEAELAGFRPFAPDQSPGVAAEQAEWFSQGASARALDEEGAAIFPLQPQPPVTPLPMAPMIGVGQVIENRPSEVAPCDENAAARPFELLDGEAGELLDLLDEFKAEAGQTIQVEDFDTHYNLGLAYKDMEMFDEAVEEFQQAFKSAMSDPASQNYLFCCSLLGFCFTRKKLPRLAVMWFKRGLDSPGHTEDEYQALRFDLAEAYVSLGEPQQAHDLFSEVYGIDVNYRGVKARLQELEGQMAQG
jgi:tetratricopeptide (TPR) repeat protein